ncbi:MAG: PDZ domain-containing protein [Planctomycetota bacterium]|nr:PDZ domain-containing protein [Planctomycetota bacterium]
MPNRTHMILSLAALTLAGTGLASAQRNSIPDTRPPVDEVIGMLDSPLFAARRQALASLLERRDLTLDEVDLWRYRDDLSPEQRLRLDELALQVFARGPRAALGISFPPDDRGGVRIMNVVAGFPAADLLVAGDRILTADGLPLTRQAMLRAAILSHAPGEILELRVERDGETLDISVPLGSFGNLRGAASPRPSDLVAAWTLRQTRDGAAQRGKPITPVPRQPGAADNQTPGNTDPDSAAWLAVYATGDAPGWLVLGGQPRETADLSLTRLAALDASRAVTIEDPELLGNADLVLQLAILRNERTQAIEDIRRLEALIGGGNLDAGGRAMMRRRLDQEREKLAVLEEQIRLVDKTRREKR